MEDESHKKTKFKLNMYTSKLSYLKSELEYVNEMFDEYNKLFMNEFSVELDYVRNRNMKLYDKIKKEELNKMREKEDKYNKQQNDSNEEHENSDEEKRDSDEEKGDSDEEKSDKPKDKKKDIKKEILKKLYRKIAVITHPDKINKINDQSLKNKLTLLFKKADKYYKKNMLLNLILIANELNINSHQEIFKIMEILCDNLSTINKYFDKEITNLETEISNVKKAVAWIWGSAETEEEKNKVKKWIYGNWGIPLDMNKTKSI